MINGSFFVLSLLLFLSCAAGPGPFYVRALALRGTMYTLISKVDEAIKDLTQVIDSEDEQVSIKVQ